MNALPTPEHDKEAVLAAIHTSAGPVLGFLRSRQGTYTVLEAPDAQETRAFGLNDRRQVVGTYRDGSTGRFRGFVWQAGHFQFFDVPFPGAIGTSLTGINNRGQMVGQYMDAADVPRGFLWDRGTFVPLEIPGAAFAAPWDINDAGQIVGNVGFDADLWTDASFVLDSTTGHMTMLTVPYPGILFTTLTGINQRGQLAGSCTRSNPDLPGRVVGCRFIATPIPQ